MRRARLATLLCAAGAALLVVFASAACSRFSPDADQDGVPDRADQCPRTPAGRAPDARGCGDVERAVARGVDALLDEPSFEVGDLWVLQQIQRLQPYPEIERMIEWWRGELGPSAFRRQIDPAAPHVLLPSEPGRGIRRFYHYVLAPFGRPEERALEFLQDFVTREASGYVLTHQLLALEWAREQGLALPESLLAARERLLQRMAAEQAADADFSDLFAERTALLLLFAETDPTAASDWIETLLRAQLASGAWEDRAPSLLEFDGERTSAIHTRAHTTAWSELALVAFLQGPRPASAHAASHP